MCVRVRSNSRHFDLFATLVCGKGFFPCDPFRPNCPAQGRPSRPGPVPIDAYWRRAPFKPGTDPGSDSEIRRNRARKIFPRQERNFLWRLRRRRTSSKSRANDVQERERGVARRGASNVCVSNFRCVSGKGKSRRRGKTGPGENRQNKNNRKFSPQTQKLKLRENSLNATVVRMIGRHGPACRQNHVPATRRKAPSMR